MRKTTTSSCTCTQLIREGGRFDLAEVHNQLSEEPSFRRILRSPGGTAL